MKFVALTVLCLLSPHLSAHAAGGSEYVYFVRPPWTLEICSYSGSEAYLTYTQGKRELRAQIRFTQFDAYSEAILSLQPIRAKAATHSKQRCWYLDSNPEGPRKFYYDFSAVEGLVALILFEHLGEIYADNPAAFQEVFIREPPLPVMRKWQQEARWTTNFHVHDRTKETVSPLNRE